MINTLKFYQRNDKLIIYAYVLMDNHFHLIISNEDISKLMQSIKKFTAREIIGNLKKGNKEFVLEEFKDAISDYKITSTHQV